MTILVCVCDYWQNCWYLELTKDQNGVNEKLLPSSSPPSSVPAHKMKNCHKTKTFNPKLSSKEDLPNHKHNNNNIDRLQQQLQQLEYERSAGGKDTNILTKKDTAESLPKINTTTTSQEGGKDTIHHHKEPSTTTTYPSKTRRIVQTIDAISAHYLLRELMEQLRFRAMLVERLESESVDQLRLQLVPPAKEIIDYKFNQMVAHDIWERVEVEYLMAWLSTLGGGFSALGEQFEHCAETAGKISLKQLAIGMRLGDPFLQARCRLYFSISLIQRGQLRAAKHIIRKQYKFANANRLQDGRLVKMCHGIWLRLRFEYDQRAATKKSKCKSLTGKVQDK